MQQERIPNVIANGDGDLWELMLWILVVFLVVLIVAIGRELLPSQKRRRRLGSDIRRIDPESVDTPIQFETLRGEDE